MKELCSQIWYPDKVTNNLMDSMIHLFSLKHITNTKTRSILYMHFEPSKSCHFKVSRTWKLTHGKMWRYRRWSWKYSSILRAKMDYWDHTNMEILSTVRTKDGFHFVTEDRGIDKWHKVVQTILSSLLPLPSLAWVTNRETSIYSIRMQKISSSVNWTNICVDCC